VPKWIALLLLAAVAGHAVGADLLVAPGQPGGNGSRERPFASLKEAFARAASGDTVHLLRGGTYREAGGLDFRSGVTVTAGGPAELPAPVVTTSVVVPGLTPWAKNPKVLTATVPGPVLALYVDGVSLRLARYPNSGWLRAGKGSTPEALVDPARARQAGAAKGRWNGAQVRWRRWSWWWETRPISDDDGVSRLTLGADNRFQDGFTGEGSAWCVDNCLAELDAPGEWFWDQADQTLYVYPPAGAGAKPVVEVVTEPKGFGAGGAIIDGLHFARIAGAALTLGRTSTVRGCTFSDLPGNGINGSWDAPGSRLLANRFRDVHNVAIDWLENPAGAGGTLIEGNRLERIGMEFGYGGSGSWKGAGIILKGGKAVAVRGNRISDTGYAGILVGSDGHLIERNVLRRCMGSLNDGAGIYVNASRTTIRDNIVLDTVGNLDTSHWWYPLGHGIWCEFLSDFREQVITGNTVVGSGGHGLFLTNNYQCTVQDNILAGNRLGGLHLSGRKGPQKHAISGNLLIAETPSRRIPYPEHIPADWKGNDHVRCLDAEGGADYGSMSGTLFVASPGTALLTIDRTRKDDTQGWAALGPWLDLAPKIQRATALILINDTEQSLEMPVPSGSWALASGGPAGKAVAVAPFRSQVLLAARDGAGLPPYVLASEETKDADAGKKGRPAKKPKPNTVSR
jgi:parallel beta-helix repeat protein